MKQPHSRAIFVGVRELKNKLTANLRLAKAGHEVIVTERGKPVAVIQPIDSARAKSREAKLASLEAEGLLTAPEKRRQVKIRPIKIRGPLLSEQILADRR
jgi:prevent-host-death family protein